MLSRLKSPTFRTLRQVCHRVSGSGVGRLPGVARFYDFTFKHLWLNKETIDIHGSHMYVNSDGLPRSYQNAFRDYIMLDWEKPTTEIFKEAVKQGDVILDLGANMGFFTLLAARLVGQGGKVYSFEPEPNNYSLLLRNIELNKYKNVTAIQKAVSNRSGTAKLYVSAEDIGNSTIYEYGDGRKSIDIETVSLDDFFTDKEKRVDLIKMDIEGAEMAAFQGMEGIIRRNRDIKIFCEFYPSLMKSMGYLPESFIQKLMDDYHFSIRPIDYLPTRTREQSAITSVSELMNFFHKVEVLNLFLEAK